MKKNILGLFLTVGVSGFALAGNGHNQNEDSSLFEKTEFKKEDSSCTISIKTTIKDNCGYTIRTRVESYEASGGTCNGIEGGVAIYSRTEHLFSGNCGSLKEKIENIF